MLVVGSMLFAVSVRALGGLRLFARHGTKARLGSGAAAEENEGEEKGDVLHGPGEIAEPPRPVKRR
jgi:hypothetical protein